MLKDPSKKKTLLIGWDAADWRAIDPLIKAGKMPNLEALIEGGVRGNLATLNPMLSPMLWSSIATGKRPYKHGIHGFSEPDPVSGGIRPVTNLSRKAKAIWNILNQNGKETITVGWWPSNPAEPLSKGVMVSNDYQKAGACSRDNWPMKEGTVHPERLEETLKEIRFHAEELEADDFAHFLPAIVGMDEEELKKVTKDPRLQSLGKIIADCTSIHSAATALIQNESWDLMSVYYDAIDHFGHAFMKYHPPQRGGIDDWDYKIFNYVVEAGYRYHDMLLGVLVKLAREQNPDVHVMLISDHGFHPDELRLTSIPNEPAGPAAEHRKYGIIVGNGPDFKTGASVHGASLLDICPTLLHMNGFPIAEDMDGKVLMEMFEVSEQVKVIPSWEDVKGDHGMHDPDKTISPEDAKASLDQLVALGYIDEPNADKSKALEETVRELDYNLAQSYMDGGIYSEALIILERLYGQWPLEHRFGMKLSVCFQALGRINEQKELVNTIIQRRMDSANQAMAKLHELGVEDKESVESYIKGLAELENEERQNKLKDFQQTLKVAQPNLFGLKYLEASAEFADGNFEECLEKLNHLEEDAGAKLNTLILRAQAHTRLRNFNCAKADFKQGLILDPENAACLGGLARLAMADRDFGQAVELMNESLSLTFHNPRGHYILGMAYFRKGDWESAMDCFKISLKQAPLYPASWRMLAQIAKDHLHDPRQIIFFKEQFKVARQRLKETQQKKLLQTAEANEQLETRQPMPELNAETSGLMHIAENKIITIVSGLPRSGTSLLMQMLKAAGLPVYEDGKRLADESNQKGYYEHAKVTQLLNVTASEKSWISHVKGSALKVVAPLLRSLPLYDQNWTPLEGQDSSQRSKLHYRVIFMERPLEQVLDSQNKMMQKLGKQVPKGDPTKGYLQQVRAAKTWLNAHGIPAISIDFKKLMDGAESEIISLASFIGKEDKYEVMQSIIDPSLYRSRVL